MIDIGQMRLIIKLFKGYLPVIDLCQWRLAFVVLTCATQDAKNDTGKFYMTTIVQTLDIMFVIAMEDTSPTA